MEDGYTIWMVLKCTKIKQLNRASIHTPYTETRKIISVVNTVTRFSFFLSVRPSVRPSVGRPNMYHIGFTSAVASALRLLWLI